MFRCVEFPLLSFRWSIAKIVVLLVPVSAAQKHWISQEYSTTTCAMWFLDSFSMKNNQASFIAHVLRIHVPPFVHSTPHPSNTTLILTSLHRLNLTGQVSCFSILFCPSIFLSISSRNVIIFASDLPLDCPMATRSWVCKSSIQLSSCWLGKLGRLDFSPDSGGFLFETKIISH